ncbi:MAG: hypothetical protein ACREDR_23470, partial [Blastocatellia bacterium]
MSPRRMSYTAVSRLVVVCLFCFTVAGLSLSACRKSQSPLDRGMAALVEACASKRLVEPRLSGGFHAGRYQPATAPSPDPASQLDSTLVHQANDEIAEGASSLPGPRAAFWHGRYLLATGKASEALEPLRMAAENLKNDAEAQN